MNNCPCCCEELHKEFDDMDYVKEILERGNIPVDIDHGTLSHADCLKLLKKIKDAAGVQ